MHLGRQENSVGRDIEFKVFIIKAQNKHVITYNKNVLGLNSVILLVMMVVIMSMDMLTGI